MRGDKTLTILKLLKNTGIEVGDAFEAFLRAGHGASIRKIGYEQTRIQKERDAMLIPQAEERRMRARYNNLLSSLKRDGLIQDKQQKGKRLLFITDSGKKIFQKLLIKKAEALPKTIYAASLSNTFVICAFDIPENEKRKRAWLRAALSSMGMRLIQKSVWIGKIKIPKDFLETVKGLKIAQYIEIFEITKSGSLRHLA